MNNIQPKTKIKQNTYIITYKLNNSLILFNTSTEKIYSLNETSSFLWNKLKKPKSMDFLMKSLCRVYNVKHSTAKKDVQQFVERFLRKKLITIL